jgi:uncharacterized membrane protein
MTLVGTKYYPGGAVDIIVTTDSGTVTTFTGTAGADGTVSIVVTFLSINGIGTAKTISMYAKDMQTGDVSNTVPVQLNVTIVAPTLTTPTGTIQLLIY